LNEEQNAGMSLIPKLNFSPEVDRFSTQIPANFDGHNPKFCQSINSQKKTEAKQNGEVLEM